MDRAGLTKFAWLSIAVAIATISLKASAYYITGSVGLLSDGPESIGF
jgi:divalent metal cation (Fe/Co/Zn/Cd) transporter